MPYMMRVWSTKVGVVGYEVVVVIRRPICITPRRQKTKKPEDKDGGPRICVSERWKEGNSGKRVRGYPFI